MEIMLSHLGVGMAYDALDGLNIHAQRLHTTVFAKLPAFKVIFQNPSCQPTSVNEDGWRCRSLDGKDGRKLLFGGSFINQSGSIISR